ncbi:MAG: DUF2321 domain-containing protein [Acidimicrobiales bacterium]
MDRYSASICMRGHYDRSVLERQGGHANAFCSRCGAPVITACLSCGDRLLGAYTGVAVAGLQPNTFCSACGSPYSWAAREALVLQLRNQLEFESGLDNADRLELIEQLAVLSRPEEESKKRLKAGHRVKQLAPKGWAMAQPLLQTLLSAELRRQLGLPPPG